MLTYTVPMTIAQQTFGIIYRKARKDTLKYACALQCGCCIIERMHIRLYSAQPNKSNTKVWAEKTYDVHPKSQHNQSNGPIKNAHIPLPLLFTNTSDRREESCVCRGPEEVGEKSRGEGEESGEFGFELFDFK